MPMERKRSAKEATNRHSFGIQLSPLCHVACVEAALAVGRVEDALTAIGMMDAGAARDALQVRTESLARALEID